MDVVVIKVTVTHYVLTIVLYVLIGERRENRWGNASFEEEEWLCQLSWMSCSVTV